MTDGRALLEAHLNGEPLTEAQRAALSAWVCASRDNARLVAELTHFNEAIALNIKAQSFGSLMDSLEADLFQDAFDQDAPSAERDETQLPPIHLDANALTKEKYLSALSYLVKHTFTPKRVVTFATAAALLLAMVITIALMTGPDPQTITDNTPQNNPATATQSTPRGSTPGTPPAATPVATLTNTHNAQWAERALARGSDLHAGTRLTLTQGFAEITTARGAIAILEAPATLELINDNTLHLHTGKLVGICETESSKGFAVQTDYCTVVDIGTKFGVSALPTGVEATVFVGEIAVQTPNEPTTVVTQNQTARLSIGSDGPSLVVEDKLAQGYTNWQPRPAVITSATLNDERFNLEIVAQGIYEDALIYSDRDYQINGLDAEGLPAALLGGDLIRMPADARTGRTADIGKLRVEVELSERCDIYLIAAPNHASLDWVKRDYELTPMRVGLDVSDSFVREQNPLGLGVGPGQSIDETLHVWKRKQPAIGRITFGPSHDQSMYSIVVVPTGNDLN